MRSLRDGSQDGRLLGAGHNLQKIVITKQNGVLQYRRADHRFDIARQAGNDILRHVGRVLDLFGNDLAHLGQLVLGKRVEDVDRQFLEVACLAGIDVRDETADLMRQDQSDFVIGVGCEELLGLTRRGRVLGDGTANIRRGIGGQEVEDFGSGVGSSGEVFANARVGVAGDFFFLLVGDRRLVLALGPTEKPI